jgi:hypothetical protein
MPSKGVDFFSFIAIDSTVINFAGPQVGRLNTANDNFTKNHLEIEWKNLPWWQWVGKFKWDILRNGEIIYSREQKINTLTGNLRKGNLSPLIDTPAVIGPDYVITYGL